MMQSAMNTQAPVATVGGRRKTVTATENVLNVMADVSVQNERINGLDSQLRYQCDFELS